MDPEALFQLPSRLFEPDCPPELPSTAARSPYFAAGLPIDSDRVVDKQTKDFRSAFSNVVACQNIDVYLSLLADSKDGSCLIAVSGLSNPASHAFLARSRPYCLQSHLHKAHGLFPSDWPRTSR